MAAEDSPETDPEDAFALIGNETRAAILRVLGEAAHETLSFSELRSRVDADIDSGRFNYHLGKLRGQFVRATDDGYKIRHEGHALYRTIRAGTFNRRASIEPFDAGFECHYCGHGVTAGYDDGMFEVSCPDCGHVYAYTRVPPSAVEDANPGEILARVDQYNRHERLACVRGVCPRCVDALALDFVPGEDLWLEAGERLDVFAHLACDHCGFEYYLTIGSALLHHPTLIAFLERQGVAVETTPPWAFEFAATDRRLTVRSRDPWEFVVAVTAGGETLELVVDDELDVVETRDPA